MNEEASRRSFGSTPLPDVISGLHGCCASGVLEVRSSVARRQLHFVRGELRAASSSAESEKLGSWLVQSKVITQAHKNLTLSSQGGSKAPPLGHLLVARGITSESVLEKQLELLALTIIERATLDRRVACWFEEGHRKEQPDTLPNVSTPQLVLFSARLINGVDRLRDSIGPADQVVECSGTLDRVVQEFDLTMPEKILVGKLHRRRTVEHLQELSLLGDADFLSALYALSAAGIVNLRLGAPEEEPEGTPAPIRAAASGPGAFREAPSPGGRAAPLQDRGTTPTSGGQPARQPPGPSRATPGEADAPLSSMGMATADRIAERELVLRLAGEAADKDYYAMLGLNPHVTYQQVFDAWDHYSRRFNPRRAAEAHLSDLRDALRTIYEHAEEAFETLSSPERRPRYDRMQRAQEYANGGEEAPAVIPSTRGIDIDAILERAEAMVNGGDLFSAIKLLEETSDSHPDPAVLLRLAKLMLLNPSWANRALEKLRRAVEIDPRFVDGWLEVAEFWRRRRSPERQRKALERALAAEPGNRRAGELYRQLVGEKELMSFVARARGKG